MKTKTTKATKCLNPQAGRATPQVTLDIVNLTTGEVIYTKKCNWGVEDVMANNMTHNPGVPEGHYIRQTKPTYEQLGNPNTAY